MNNEEEPRSKTQPIKKPFARSSRNVIFSEEFEVEGKKIICTLSQNERGRFIRIIEDAGERKPNIIVPFAGLEQLRSCLDKISAQLNT